MPDMWSNKSPRQKRRRAVFLLGLLLIILGSFSAVLGVSAAAEFSWSMEHRLSAPVWGGLMVILTGATTTFTIQRNKHKHLFYVLLGVSVAGMTVSFPQWILSLSGLINDGDLCSESALDVHSNLEIVRDYVASKALHGVCLVLGFAETLASFSLAILASVGICDSGETSTSRLERQTRQSIRESIRRNSTRGSIRAVPVRPAVVRLHLASGSRLYPPPQTGQPPPYAEETGSRTPYTTETHIGPRAHTSPPPYAEETRSRGPNTTETHVGPRAHTSPPPYAEETRSRGPNTTETHVGPRAHTSPPPYAEETRSRGPNTTDTHAGPRAHTSPPPYREETGSRGLSRAHTSPRDVATHDPPPPYRSREDVSQI